MIARPQFDFWLHCIGWLTRLRGEASPEAVWCSFCHERPGVLVAATVREQSA